jgi:hypothetical protein
VFEALFAADREAREVARAALDQVRPVPDRG